MDIFSDDLQFDEVDFSIYYNEDGEPEEIDDMDEERLSNLISTMDRHSKMQPEHYNVEIWQEYRRRFAEALYEE